ncbi:hypothetical protein [Leifsonia sp. Leaf264]|uniref:hypothetical protein n=1 Tax=Leifsonia sp. Leaf264 TaxID=1736314 RepID=UPI0006FB7BF5|nr:hypothetical protein [Leifsonia sp. Leaf264]KQO98159.1 hypothetical protein ASF30_08855 [Leifsonia sp. Leaf264]
MSGTTNRSNGTTPDLKSGEVNKPGTFSSQVPTPPVDGVVAGNGGRIIVVDGDGGYDLTDPTGILKNPSAHYDVDYGWTVSAQQFVDMISLAPAVLDGRRWADRNWRVIDDFILDRYTATRAGFDEAGVPSYVTYVELDVDDHVELTEEQALDTLRTQTKLTQLHTDALASGPGSLQHNLLEHVGRQVVADLPGWAHGAGGVVELSDEIIGTDVAHSRVGTDIITDDVAYAIAKRIRDAAEKSSGSAEHTGRLHQLIQNQYTDGGHLITELGRIYANGYADSVDSRWKDALSKWADR